MTTEAPKTKRAKLNLLEVVVLLIILCMIFRVTAAVMLILLVSLQLFFPLHGSRRAIIMSEVLFCIALLLPVDVHVPGFHSSVDSSKHSGPRFVPVLHGMLMLEQCRKEYGEFISGGCSAGINPTRWMFVWD
ncbi:MAG: hypothetical protein QM813_12300 [Verrucomicrobiota bacterium]